MPNTPRPSIELGSPTHAGRKDSTTDQGSPKNPSAIALAVGAALEHPVPTAATRLSPSTWSEVSNWSQAICYLLKTLHINLSEESLRWFFKFSGKMITALAMIPQGILAGLLMFSLAQHAAGSEVAGILAAAIAGAAFLGKYILIEYLGRGNYVGWLEGPLPSRESFRGLTIRSVTLGLGNKLLSANAAIMFGYLAYLSSVSSSGLGPLLRNTFHSETAASIVENPGFWMPFGTASIIANLLSFPIIHTLGIQALKGIGAHLFSSVRDEREFLIAEAKMRYGLNAITKAWQERLTQLRNPADSGSPDKSARILALLHIMAGSEPVATADIHTEITRVLSELKTKLPAELIAGLQAIANHEGYDPTLSVSPWGSKASNALALGVALTTAWGFSNFFGIGRDMGRDMSGYLGASEGTAAIVGTLTGSMGMASMTIMAALTAGFGIYNGERIFRKEQRAIYPEILTPFWQKWILVEANIVCILGGMPNVFQAIFTGQPLPDMVLAELSSFSMELFGYLESRYDSAEGKTLAEFVKTDPKIKEVMELIQSFKYSNVDHPGPTAIRELIRTLRELIRACDTKLADCISGGGETNRPAEALAMMVPLLRREETPSASVGAAA